MEPAYLVVSDLMVSEACELFARMREKSRPDQISQMFSTSVLWRPLPLWSVQQRLHSGDSLRTGSTKDQSATGWTENFLDTPHALAKAISRN